MIISFYPSSSHPQQEFTPDNSGVAIVAHHRLHIFQSSVAYRPLANQRRAQTLETDQRTIYTKG